MPHLRPATPTNQCAAPATPPRTPRTHLPLFQNPAPQRNGGAFQEKATNTIADDPVAAIRPRFLRVDTDRFVRGVIDTRIRLAHRRQGRAAAAAAVRLPGAPDAGVPA